MEGGEREKARSFSLCWSVLFLLILIKAVISTLSLLADIYILHGLNGASFSTRPFCMLTPVITH